MIHHVVALSGGMDSYTLIHYVNKNRLPESALHAISFDYNQRHCLELEKAKLIAGRLNIDHIIVWLPFLVDFTPGSSLTDMSTTVPKGHYADESMKQTVVPGRNTLFLACALSFAQGLLEHQDDKAAIYYAAHAGDHPIYPDCRPDYIAAMKGAICLASDGAVSLDAPFTGLTKGDILKIGLDLGLDYAMSHTCYEGVSPPCGKCGACVERREAFEQNNAIDPLVREYA